MNLTGVDTPVKLPAGFTVELPSTVQIFDGLAYQGDSWTAGELHCVVTDDGLFYQREVSITQDFAYGAGASLPLAVTLLCIWAVKRGLRPSLENL